MTIYLHFSTYKQYYKKHFYTYILHVFKEKFLEVELLSLYVFSGYMHFQ
jgi:hypothetical protein